MQKSTLNSHETALQQLTLGQSLLHAGRIDEAIAQIQEALRLDRRNIDACLLLGDAYQEKKDYATAIAHYQKGLKLNRAIPALYNNLGNARMALGEFQEAITLYQKALSLQPSYADAYFNMGNTYLALKQHEDALICYRHLLQKQPQYYKAHSMEGMTLRAMGRSEEALQSYQQALTFCPDNTQEKAIILNNLGNLYQALRQFDNAVQCYAHSYAIQENLLAQTQQPQPLLIPTLGSLATALAEQGRTEESILIYNSLTERFPANPIYRLNAAFKLPVVYQDQTDIERWRKRFEETVDELRQAHLTPLNEEALNGLAATGFYLSYQGLNDCGLQRKIAQIFRKIRAPYSPLPIVRNKNSDKPKIGFVSRHLSEKHTIGKFMQGILRKLPRNDWNVRIFSVGDTVTVNGVDASEIIQLPGENLRECRGLIQAEEVDLLFYSDVGMDPLTKLLANERLAPVQCVTWGHPVTTGLPTIDYFISSQWIEPENANSHYTEQLILLDNLPTYYYRPTLPTNAYIREHLNLPVNAHIYVCPQALFKFHPDFDDVLRQILEADPQGYLILMQHYSQGVQQQLLGRFQKKMSPSVLDRIRWVSRLQHLSFLELMASADVMLDSLYFGGGNTTYEALSFGTPIITLPGEFMRGRITTGCYQKMGMTDCIANDTADYVQRAVRLGQDPAERQRMKNRILETCPVLYEDDKVIPALEAFFYMALSRV